jgi:hypothetical protein
MKHKTLWLVLVWIIAAAVALGAAFAGAALPLTEIVTLAGVTSLAYVGVSKTINIVTAAKSPSGEFGYEYVEPLQDKHLWVVIIWLVIFGATIALATLRPDSGAPVEAALAVAGTLSAAYVGLDKGAKVAAATGTADKAAA